MRVLFDVTKDGRLVPVIIPVDCRVLASNREVATVAEAFSLATGFALCEFVEDGGGIEALAEAVKDAEEEEEQEEPAGC